MPKSKRSYCLCLPFPSLGLLLQANILIEEVIAGDG